MRLPQTGGCQCGAIRCEVREALHLVYIVTARNVSV